MDLNIKILLRKFSFLLLNRGSVMVKNMNFRARCPEFKFSSAMLAM